MPTARKAPSGPAAIVMDLNRTVALVSMTNATSQSFSFALNAAQCGQGCNPGDVVVVKPRTAFSGVSVIVSASAISALNTVKVTIANADAASIAAQTATIDTIVFLQGET